MKRNIVVAGFGKAVLGMATALEHLIGDHIVDGVVSVPKGSVETMKDKLPHLLLKPSSVIKVCEGASNNLPDYEACETTNEIIQRLKLATAEDIVIMLISGGGSALLTAPADGISLADMHTTTKLLASKGATINELNTVRKHLSRVKGGQLAVAAHPAQVYTLILSDVIGDPLDVIASGPTVPDPSTFSDCDAILERLKVTSDIPETVSVHLKNGVRGYIEDTPDSNHPVFKQGKVHNMLVGTNKIALDASKQKALDLGYEVLVLRTPLEGNARDVASDVVNQLQTLKSGTAKCCFLAGGETTCIVKGSGKGGRNQELALAAALELHEKELMNGFVVLSAGTDGQDGPTDAAGAFGDADLVHRCKSAGLNPQAFLEDNNSYNLFNKVGGLLRTGLSGTNVMDIVVGLAT